MCDNTIPVTVFHVNHFFPSPLLGGEDSVTGAERPRRAAQRLHVEQDGVDGNQQPLVVQLTPAVLERHPQALTEKLRSGMARRVHKAIQQSSARALVGIEGWLTLEAKPGGLLEVEENMAQLGCREE